MGTRTQKLVPTSTRVTRKRKQLHDDATEASSSKAVAPPKAPTPARGKKAAAKAQPTQEEDTSKGKKPAAKKLKLGDTADEKRQRRFRPKPPQSFYDIFERATTQRFFVLTRTRCGTPSCPEEKVELTGSTGNIYHVHIAEVPSCDCPHAEKGNQCKHLLYVMSRVLRAKFDLVYQLALLPSELQEVLANAPPIPDLSSPDTHDASSSDKDKNRKPVEGDCPICFEELQPGDKKTGEAIVWCRAACGQNMHKQCLQMWSATKRQQAGAGGTATCPLCRTPWAGDDDNTVENIKRDGPVNSDGYVNVADQLGISSQRDYSSYSSWMGYRSSGYSANYRSRYRGRW